MSSAVYQTPSRSALRHIAFLGVTENTRVIVPEFPSLFPLPSTPLSACFGACNRSIYRSLSNSGRADGRADGGCSGGTAARSIAPALSLSLQQCSGGTGRAGPHRPGRTAVIRPCSGRRWAVTADAADTARNMTTERAFLWSYRLADIAAGATNFKLQSFNFCFEIALQVGCARQWSCNSTAYPTWSDIRMKFIKLLAQYLKSKASQRWVTQITTSVHVGCHTKAFLPRWDKSNITFTVLFPGSTSARRLLASGFLELPPEKYRLQTSAHFYIDFISQLAAENRVGRKSGKSAAQSGGAGADKGGPNTWPGHNNASRPGNGSRTTEKREKRRLFEIRSDVSWYGHQKSQSSVWISKDA